VLPFGLSQTLWLIGIAGTAAALCFLCRAKRLSHRVVRVFLACGLATTEIERTLRDGIHFPDRLPLNLCNVSTWVAVLALVTLWPLAVEFVYFVGLSGAVMALLVPDTWPFRFFLNHGGTVIAATVLVFGHLGPAGLVRRGAVWRSFGLLAIYAALLGIFDWAFGTNYGYLRRKPVGVSLMSLMGPWPFYLAWAGLAAIALFWLMWIPVRKSAS
jgi:hypothetical integral membrane protein (TIGR02206 family)